MTALLTTANWDSDAWMHQLRTAAPDRRFVLEGVDAYDPAEIRYALTWKPPQGLLSSLPNLEVIFNLGAGVDAVLSDPDLPDLPLVRLVDENLASRMTEWVTLQVLAHHRGTLTYLAQQKAHRWHEEPQPLASEVRVGFLGYGVLAQHAARVIGALGFATHAWSRTGKDADIKLHVGADALPEFLANTDILVVLLPLTDATRKIINADLMAGLAQDGALGGPVVINAGRGGLQDEDDIVAALNTNVLKGASLDVFQTEPLPADSPLWTAPNLIITPHNSAVSDPRAVSRYVARQMQAFEAGEPLQNVVDRSRGY
ncbi:glyoxylate/hydroxypyruvate reductase A [Acuticoccus sp. MNP-M23]|uniref:2-hydroxyacid dehydrogenase n=1 Tax=Acuticoccus sp. MNP-M23 TaxID=3072793 RepID=UPI002814D76D|nr:glyoxylate/hydroxypyruvate reductase A [Acuticoccus sp. MNP-M23]WMS41244.1 glyoxylate/hydroxypyruvate reductase A [Acuticoccus sp. MNP-M23]